jgi:hypothetical protein
MPKLADIATWVDWWCQVIGVTDPNAMHVAEGIVAASLILFVLYIILILVFGILGAMISK